jgi:hypothetical protein
LIVGSVSLISIFKLERIKGKVNNCFILFSLVLSSVSLLSSLLLSLLSSLFLSLLSSPEESGIQFLCITELPAAIPTNLAVTSIAPLILFPVDK